MTTRMMGTLPVRRAPGEGDSFRALGDLYTVKVSGEGTAGAFSVVELAVSPGNGVPPHIHHREDEAFYVLEGAFSILCGDRTGEAAAGAFVYAPRGTVHSFRNLGDAPGRLLVILTPAGFERLFAEIGETGERLMALAPRYHLEIVPPPGA